MIKLNKDISSLKDKYENLREKYISDKTLYDRLNLEIEEINKEIKANEKDIDLLSKVDILFRETSNYAREQIKTSIEDTVTAFLNTIFNDNISLEIELISDQSSPVAHFYVVTELEDRIIRVNPVDSRGGGIVDIVSLALRFAVLDIYEGGLEGPIILDEPAKHVSYQYIDNVGKLLHQVSEIKGKQVIMITHNNYLAESGDIIYGISQVDGESSISLASSEI